MITLPNFLVLSLTVALCAGVGMVWYSPLLFGESWRKGMGWSAKEIKELGQKMGKRMPLMPVAVLLSVLGIAWVLETEMVFDLMTGWQVGATFWALGMLPMMLNNFTFGKQKMVSVVIDVFYQLVVCLLAASVLTLWA